jgi:hypothetical protein
MRHVGHTLVQPHVQPLARGDETVVLDRVLAARLVARDRKWMAADLDQLRRRKELHVDRIADDGVDERAFVDDADRQALPLRFDRARQPNRPGSDDEDVQHHVACITFGLWATGGGLPCWPRRV